jgi:hypothetical protein
MKPKTKTKTKHLTVSEAGALGGKKSWKVRTRSMSKEEYGEMMRKVALKRWEVLDLSK